LHKDCKEAAKDAPAARRPVSHLEIERVAAVEVFVIGYVRRQRCVHGPVPPLSVQATANDED
jgi:hypothetical protein